MDTAPVRVLVVSLEPLSGKIFRGIVILVRGKVQRGTVASPSRILIRSRKVRAETEQLHGI